MESEDKKTPAPAVADAEGKKPRTRKTAKPAAEKASTPAARKPRTRKAALKAENAAPEAPAVAPAPATADAAPAAETKPAAPKTRVRRVRTKPAPLTEGAPAAASATPAEPQQKEVPATLAQTPAPKVEEFIPTPQQPRERELEPAPGFAVPETVGGNEGGGNGGKRRRRRNRNRRGGEGQPQTQQPAQPKVDPEELVRRAWKIFLGEVTEEGLALMDDRTAAEASRRAFRVAELFLQESARHKPTVTYPATEAPTEASESSAE